MLSNMLVYKTLLSLRKWVGNESCGANPSPSYTKCRNKVWFQTVFTKSEICFIFIYFFCGCFTYVLFQWQLWLKFSNLFLWNKEQQCILFCACVSYNKSINVDDSEIFCNSKLLNVFYTPVLIMWLKCWCYNDVIMS